MRLITTSCALLLVAGAASAQRGESERAFVRPAQPQPTVQQPGGSFSGGGANCSVPTVVGTGPTAVNFPFDNTTAASMGVATNPFEALCNFAGNTGIENEEWFEWTAASDGYARLSTCSGLSTVDTKVAVYDNDCPNIVMLDPLACKDFSLNCPMFQTIVTWEIAAGTTYLLQVGTFVGGAGGASDFSIEELPNNPGQYDFGASSNAIGSGGVQLDLLWGHQYDAGSGETVDSVDIAWGLLGGTQLPAGAAATIAVYSGDPVGGLTLLGTEAITTAMENSDTFINYPLTNPIAVAGSYSVAVNYAVAAGPVFPMAIDDSANSLGRAWNAIEATTFPIDLNDPASIQFPPLDNDLSGDLFSGVFLLRVNTTPGGGGNFPEFCFGDGGDGMGCTACPCGNEAPMGTLGGCLNSGGTSGRLVGSGSTSVTAADPADLRFDASGLVAASFAVLTSGDAVAPANAANPCFGLNSGLQSAVLDGLRCAVQATQRHGGRPVDATGQVGATTNGWGGASGPPAGLAAQGGFIAGDTRFYQVFYRELPGQVCLTEQNTTQAVEVAFVP